MRWRLWVHWTAGVSQGPISSREPRSSVPSRRSARAERLRAAAICVALQIWFPFTVHVQSRTDSWTTEHGLPQNSVRDILQTRDGYLWLATEGGLARFDGVRFVVFDRSTDGITSQRIGALHEARDGTLWAATHDGFLIRYRRGRFTTLGAEHGLPKAGAPGAGAARIQEDSQGHLWISWIGVLTRFDGERATNFQPADFGLPPQRHDGYRYLDTWWRQDASTLHAVVRGRVERRALPSGVTVTGVNTDRAGNLWVKTAGAGVLEMSGGTRHYTVADGLPRNDPDGLFYADGTDAVWYVDAPTFTLYRIRAGRHEQVPIEGPRSFYVDRDGSTWIGTIASGLHRLRDEVFTVYTEQDGLPVERSYSVLEDGAGVVWIGTWDAGLAKYTDGRFTAYGIDHGLPSQRVTCIYEDRSGRLWVGTDRGLTYREGERFRRFADEAGLPDGAVWTIREDRRGVFWFGTEAGLLGLERGRVLRYTTADGLSHNHVSLLFEDRSGALWIGGYLGVTRFRDGVFTSFGAPEGLIGNEVRAFHQDAEGRFWIGTYDGGLYRLADERLTRYTKKDGLHDNGVFQILEDDQGYFWMGSNQGISRVSRTELNEVAEGRRRTVNAILFGTQHGLRTVEINGGRQPSGWRTADGRLWFPTMAGVAVIDPATLGNGGRLPVPVIEEVSVAGRAVSTTTALVLEPAAASFDVRYTAPTFVMPKHVRFRYRLTRQPTSRFTRDEAPVEWIDVGDRRTVSFHHLPPGHYILALGAADGTGVWSDGGASLPVTVLPPLWATWWFRFAAVVVGTSCLVGIHAAHVRRLRRDQAQRRVYLQELIDSQERERRRLSNEMHDSIGYDLAVLKRHAREGRERAGADEAIRRDFDDIVAVADRVDHDMKAIAFGLRPYHLDKIGLTRSVEALVHETDAMDDPTWSARIDDIDGVFPKELEIHVYRIVQEGVTNVLKHAKARRARLTIVRTAHHVEIRIDDDGGGLARSSASAGIAGGNGLGLIGIQERAQLLGGEVSVGSSHIGGTSIVVRLRSQGAIDV